MPAVKLKPTTTFLRTPERGPQLTGDLVGAPAAPSPARLLQERLERRTTNLPATPDPRWPLRSRVALIVASSMALWMAILMTTAEATRAIA